MASIFEGDPRIWIDENGAEIVFRGGQPIMDGGLENAALISLFTRRGWAGNVLFDVVSEQVGSDFEKAHEQPIVLQTLNDVRVAAQNALQWMIDERIASSVDITVSNPSSYRISTRIIIYPPGSSPTEILLTKFGNNWVVQSTDPASGRL